ncbi:MAG: hypothetical protein JWL76_220 [Thermoleophilia bacterium]|nr:hypothetical protein [Thermoleophilia bacterium]
MQTGSIIEANRALASMSSHASILERVELPRFIGRAAAKANIADLLSMAASHAEQGATTLLGVEGFSPQSVESIQTAVRLLREAPPNPAAARRAATSLRSAVGEAHASWESTLARDPAVATTHLGELVGRDPASLHAWDWTAMRELLDAAPPVSGHPRQLEGIPSLRDIAGRHERLAFHARPDLTDASQYAAAWRLGDVPTSPRPTPTRDLLQRPARELRTEDWKDMRTLLDSDPQGTTMPRTRTVDYGVTIRDVLDRRITARSTPAGAEPDYMTSLDLANIERFQAAWRLEGSTVDDRVGMLRELLAREPETFDARDWASLHALLTDDAVTRTGRGPRSIDGLIRFDEIAAKTIERPLGDAGMRSVGRYFTAWRLAGAPAEERVARASTIFQRDPARVTPEDWADLGTLLDSDPDGVILRGPRTLDGHLDFRYFVTQNAIRPTSSPGGYYQLNRYMSEWRTLLDPAYPQKVAVALDEVASGSPSPNARALVAAEGHRLAELVEGRPADEQAAIASAMLAMDDVTSSRGVEGTLKLLRSGLVADAPAADPAVGALRRQTLELVDRNLSRLAGHTPEGEVVGYGRHPDYAEVGRVRANVTLLDQLAQVDRARAGGAAAASEQLAW